MAPAVPARPGSPSTRTTARAPVTATVTAHWAVTVTPVRVVSSTGASGGLPTSRLARWWAGASRAPDRGTPRWA